MVIKSIFPTLFLDGVVSLICEFDDTTYTIEVSKLDSSVVIITGQNALNFLFNAADSVGLSSSWFDQVNVMSGTNSISIQQK
jgi:hypothetical protein